eukprot:TRINITY_DN34745_c0_g1_i1.p1 TRINITY_DN34745_c0_g1~~TRINITY_DN34745_c0_g1_i1.p1  ORF type:complete len:377 (-),score=42.34 TRINITY_DN34745_c0_g1_i1:89-1219(-)
MQFHMVLCPRLIALLFSSALSLHSPSTTDGESDVELLRSWVAHKVEYYGHPTCFVSKSGLCVLGGLIRGPGRGPIAKLSAACSPRRDLAFQVKANGSLARVNVGADGVIEWLGGGDPRASALSLAGIHFVSTGASGGGNRVAASSSPQTIPLFNGWIPHGGRFSGPSFAMHGMVCILEGLIINGGPMGVATLPRPCRPRKRVAFKSSSSHYSTARIDIHPDGSIMWRYGSTHKPEASLSGIAFLMKSHANKATALKLSKYWSTSPINELFATPTFFVQDGVCFVEGVANSIKKTAERLGKAPWRTIAKLPESCRPPRSLVFTTVGRKAVVRIHVQKNGDISLLPMGYRIGRDHIHQHIIDDFVSLSGIAFEVSDKP